MAGLNDLLTEGAGPNSPKSIGAVGGFGNAELMADARASLSGNWSVAVLGLLLFRVLLFSFMVFMVSVVLLASATGAADSAEFMERLSVLVMVLNPIGFILQGPVMVGVAAFFLGISQENEARVQLFFCGFKRFWRSFALYFFYSLFISLWSLLLVVPGIIAVFRYAMCFYVMADDEMCGPLEALRRSAEMMKGNKWRFFCLNFRFIGWALLCSMFSVGYLWLIPYMRTSFAKFYEDVS